jgi:large subunit ribosomal protein L35
MPKNKTHSGAKKRFRVTGTGKIRHERTRKVRRLSNDGEITGADARNVKKMLGL